MTAFTVRRPPRKPLIVVLGVLAFAIGTQVAAAWPSAGPVGLDEPLLAAPPPAEAAVLVDRPFRWSRRPDLGPITIPAPGKVADVDPAAELARVRADVDFWAARLTRAPRRHRRRRQARRGRFRARRA